MVKIVSDGTPMNTKVLNDNGDEIKGVRSIIITVERTEIVTAYIEFINVDLAVKAELVTNIAK